MKILYVSEIYHSRFFDPYKNVNTNYILDIVFIIRNIFVDNQVLYIYVYYIFSLSTYNYTYCTLF